MKILIADDDIVSCMLLKATLERWGDEVIAVNDGLSALAALEADDAPMLAILDWMMPGMDGPEIIRRVRAGRREPYTYAMLLTGRTQHEDLVKGMEAGADDYLHKPFRMNELKVRLRAGQRIVELQQQLIDAREALRVQATRDPLTGLFNRWAINDWLDSCLALCERDGRPMGVLVLDLDHFKNINDNFGHPAGDAVLAEVSSRLRSQLRRSDGVGRYGGEEFLVVLPGCDEKLTLMAAERLRACLADAPVVCRDAVISVTCSAGAAVWTASNPKDPETLIREADQALYRSKAGGRDQVTPSWDPDDTARAAS
jgi:diguanylate cyclase (GGDEF)-like protein